MFDGVHPWMKPLTFFYLIIIPIGVIGNFIMILCYFLNPRLRTPFHTLLTLTCFADLIHVCGQILFVLQLLNGTYSNQSTCFLINLLPIIGLSIAGPLLLQIGLDRLLAVSCPFKYRDLQLHRFGYTLLHLIFPILYTSVIISLGYANRNDELVKCAIPTALAGSSFKTFTLSSHAIYISIVCAYSITFILLKMHDASSRFKCAFKSIAVTIALVLFGWTITTVSNTFGYFITSDPETFNLIQMYSGITVNIACSANVFVFYAINPEYQLTMRTILQGTFRKMPSFAYSGSELVPIQKQPES